MKTTDPACNPSKQAIPVLHSGPCYYVSAELDNLQREIWVVRRHDNGQQVGPNHPAPFSASAAAEQLEKTSNQLGLTL